MFSFLKKVNLFWFMVFVFLSYALLQQWKYDKSPEKKARYSMKTRYIGRFSIAVPALMEEKLRSSTVRYADVEEVVWPNTQSSEITRSAEWERFVDKVRKFEPPEGVHASIIKTRDVSANGKWAKAMFFYNEQATCTGAEWRLLWDAGQVGVWLKMSNLYVDKELKDFKTLMDLREIAAAYQPLDDLILYDKLPVNAFFLRHGVIALPYLEEEESTTRFEGHPLNLTVIIEMYMDFTKRIEDASLINGHRAAMAAALLVPGGGLSKIRLKSRDVAGMPGEESVLRVREGDRKDLLFTWRFNGRKDSGEYPTTEITMETPDGHLQEKLRIWDAMLDSMKPVFERKKQ